MLFYKNKNNYLGHIISEEGILVDLEKIKSIMNWSTTRNITDVRYFMDFNINYFLPLNMCMKHISFHGLFPLHLQTTSLNVYHLPH